MNKSTTLIGIVLLFVIAISTIAWVPGLSTWMKTSFTGLPSESDKVEVAKPAHVAFGAMQNGGSPLSEKSRLVDIDSSNTQSISDDSALRPAVQFASMTQGPQTQTRLNDNPPSNPLPQDTSKRIPLNGLSVPSATVAAPTNPYILIAEGGQLVFVKDIDVCAQSDGLIVQLNVDQGSNVKAGDLMIEIDSRIALSEEAVATQEWEAAVVKAEDDSNVRYSKAAVAVSKIEVERSERMFLEDAESDSDVRKKKLELVKSELQLETSLAEKKKDAKAVGVAEAKLNVSKVQLTLRTILAPFDGTVADVMKQQFSWVRAGEPILKYSSMQKLRAKGLVKVNDAPHLLLGMPAKVTIYLAPDRPEVIEGVVGFVAPKTDGDDKYNIFVEVPNRIVDGNYLYRSGMTVRIEINTARNR